MTHLELQSNQTPFRFIFARTPFLFILGFFTIDASRRRRFRRVCYCCKLNALVPRYVNPMQFSTRELGLSRPHTSSSTLVLCKNTRSPTPSRAINAYKESSLTICPLNRSEPSPVIGPRINCFRLGSTAASPSLTNSSRESAVFPFRYNCRAYQN